MAITFRVRPGELKTIVIIEQKSTTRGSSGEIVESWSTFATIRMKALPLRGREGSESRRETGKIEGRYWCRYKSGLTQGMRMKIGTRYLDIVSVVNVEEKGLWMEITAIETI